MGKRGSDLCRFIKKGLRKNKYPNLEMISDNPLTFGIYFPRKTTKLDPSFELFLKDWRSLKNKPYKYSMAKQAVETALKKSDFFKKMPSTKANMLIYQILDEDQIVEKKKSRGIRIKEEYQNPLSVESSGYGSGGDTGNSFTSSDEEMEFKIDGVHVPNEQFVIVQNFEDHYPVNAFPYSFEDSDTSSEHDLVSVNPNEIMIDQRNDIWQHFNDMFKGEISEQEGESASESQDPTVDSSDRYYLQDAFSDIDFEGADFDIPFKGDAVDFNELMNVDIEEFQEVEKKPEMPTYYLKEVKCTDDGEVLIFSPNAFEEMKSFRNEPNVKDESRIPVDNKQMGKISAAIRSPLNIGLVNGEIHLCVKY